MVAIAMAAAAVRDDLLDPEVRAQDLGERDRPDRGTRSHGPAPFGGNRRDAVGEIPAGLTHFRIPALRLDLVRACSRPCSPSPCSGYAIESLMSAVVAPIVMSGDRHNPNVELIAQGIAKVASPMFGGLPPPARECATATNTAREPDPCRG